MSNWIKELESISNTKKYAKNELIFSAGEPANYFYLVKTGAVRIYKSELTGKEIEINRIKPGQIFAEAFVLGNNIYTVSASTASESEIIQYCKTDVINEINKNPKLGLALIQILATRCIKLNQSIENISIEELPKRLTRYILREIDTQKPNSSTHDCLIELHITKKELASQLGTIPETLSRCFEKLHSLNLIKVFGKTIIIPDRNKLETH
jgi:CRP/FNR family transcriptional regulator, dissimilatory nitrate respiration regulator